MRLSVVTPEAVVLEVDAVERLVLETPSGAWGFLPRRLDAVAPIEPGLLRYVVGGREEVVAVDRGVFTKVGPEARVCVRHAVTGALAELRETAVERFRATDEQSKAIRDALAHLESRFIRKQTEIGP